MTGFVARCLRARAKGARLALAIWIAVPSVGAAQPIPASTLKAAYMLNFIKFGEWPAREPKVPTIICVSGDDGIEDVLTRTVAGQTVDGHPIQVTRIAAGGTVKGCQILFVGDREKRRLAAILQEAGQFDILTVSDIEGAATHGVMIEFFRENDRLRFAVNMETLERSHIKLSSRLLALAVIVRPRDQ